MKINNLRDAWNIFKFKIAIFCISKKDLLFILSIPIVLSILFILTIYYPELIDKLKLDLANHSYYQFYTASLINYNFAHFKNNLLSIFIFLYLIAFFIKRLDIKYVYTKITLGLLPLPILSNLASYIVFYKIAGLNKAIAGSSDIMTGIIGLALFASVAYISKKEKYKLKIPSLYAIIGLILIQGLITITVYYTNEIDFINVINNSFLYFYSIILFYICLIVSIFIWHKYNPIALIKSKNIDWVEKILILIIFVCVPIIFVISKTIYLPNEVAHFTGLIYGLFLGYLIFFNN